MPKRYRLNFPKDPRHTLAAFRIWGAQNYSVFFQRKDRFSDAREIIEDLLKQKWVKSYNENGQIQMSLSVLQVLDKTMEMINKERIANDIKLQETASSLKNNWTTFLGIFSSDSFFDANAKWYDFTLRI